MPDKNEPTFAKLAAQVDQLISMAQGIREEIDYQQQLVNLVALENQKIKEAILEIPNIPAYIEFGDKR